jgi:pimeloyl-ACP methyl ester carboxylesterase
VSVDDPELVTQNSYTFVLVHGGCHDGSLWQPVIEHIEQRGHTAYGPTVAGHGKGVPKNVTHVESTQSIVDFIVERDLSDFILVGHGYAGTIISKVVEVIPERVRRLVFWSAYVLNDGETALEMLPDSVEVLRQLSADSPDNTFMIPFDMWRDVFINDGQPDLVQRAYGSSSISDLKCSWSHSVAVPLQKRGG